jgi:predicted nucleotidyltransferase
MMKGTTQTKQDLERLLSKLIAGYAPQRVFLFGSHVYGEPDQHSDLNLLIVKETTRSPFQRRVEVGRIVQDRSRRTPIQPLVISPEELEERIRSGDPFLTEIVEKGEVVYDAERVQTAG